MSKMRLKIWVASRFSGRMELEEIMMKFALTLRPFNKENQITFLEQYWNNKIKGLCRNVYEILPKSCSDRLQRTSVTEGQFTGIPLQTMMLGEAFAKEAKNYCSNREVNLPQNFNLLALSKKFTENICNTSFRDTNGIDISKPKVIKFIQASIENHTNAALMSLLSPDEVKQVMDVRYSKYLEYTREFLQSEELRILKAELSSSEALN
jgi:hypothetical protein